MYIYEVKINSTLIYCSNASLFSVSLLCLSSSFHFLNTEALRTLVLGSLLLACTLHSHPRRAPYIYIIYFIAVVKGCCTIHRAKSRDCRILTATFRINVRRFYMFIKNHFFFLLYLWLGYISQNPFWFSVDTWLISHQMNVGERDYETCRSGHSNLTCGPPRSVSLLIFQPCTKKSVEILKCLGAFGATGQKEAWSLISCMESSLGSIQAISSDLNYDMSEK